MPTSNTHSENLQKMTKVDNKSALCRRTKVDYKSAIYKSDKS